MADYTPDCCSTIWPSWRVPLVPGLALVLRHKTILGPRLGARWADARVVDDRREAVEPVVATYHLKAMEDYSRDG